MTEYVYVKAASILGMGFSFLVAVGVPVALCIVMKVKGKAKLSSCWIGAGTFVVFVLVLEQLFHVVVLQATGTLITGNIWLYALYGGLAAGLFEETGRYLAMRFLMKKNLNRQNALMYGVGHGGIEAILLVGLAEISNIAVSLFINSGQADTLFASLGGVDESVQASLAQLWELPSYQFYMAGVERIIAITLQIALSYLVYRAVRGRRLRFYFLAVALHFLVDAVAVTLNVYLSVAALEGVLLVMVALIGVWVYWMGRNEKTAVSLGEQTTNTAYGERHYEK